MVELWLHRRELGFPPARLSPDEISEFRHRVSELTPRTAAPIDFGVRASTPPESGTGEAGDPYVL